MFIKLFLSFLVTSFVLADDQKLRWCTSRCLCQEENTAIKCFKPEEIFIKLFDQEDNFPALNELENDFTWCSGSCLCHKHGLKTYQCGNNDTMQAEIISLAPFLSNYFDKGYVLAPSRKTEIAMERRERRRIRQSRRRKKFHKMLKDNGTDDENMDWWEDDYQGLNLLHTVFRDECYWIYKHMEFIKIVVIVNTGMFLFNFLAMVMYCCFKCCGQCCQKKASKDISTKSKKSPKDSDEMKVNMNDGW